MSKLGKILILVVVLSLAVAALSACNMKAEESHKVLSEAIKATKNSGFETEFDVKNSNLVLYPAKQKAKYTKEADSAKTTLYCYSDNAEENRSKGINRTNWNDEDSTEWITEAYHFNLKYDGGYGGSATITKPKERNPETGEVVGEDVNVTVAYDNLAWLDDIFAKTLSSDVKYTGLKRGTKRIIRVETEQIRLEDGTMAIKQEDGSFLSTTGKVVKRKGADDYEWSVGIAEIVLDRIDYTVKKGKIESIEVYTEVIGYKDCDQRNYLKSGRIYTVKKAMVIGRVQAIINF